MDGGSVQNNFSKMLGSRKLKISTVARETGISRTTLTDLYYEKSTAISYSVLGTLCKYFNCEIGDLLIKKPEVTPCQKNLS